METQFGIQLERCNECNARVPLDQMVSHIYTVHPSKVEFSIECQLCYRTLRDPLLLPTCQHPSCFCLLCVYHILLKKGQEKSSRDVECPICLSDLKELVTYISKNKQPDFKFDDILPIHLEAFIDANKTKQIYRTVKKNNINELKLLEQNKLMDMKQKNNKLINIQMNNLINDIINDEKSIELRNQNQLDVTYWKEIKKKKKKKKKEFRHNGTVLNKTGMNGNSTDQCLSPSLSLKSPVTLSLLEKEEMKVQQMKEKTKEFNLLKEVFKKNKNARKQKLQSRLDDKRRRMEHLKIHVEKQLLLHEKKINLKIKKKKNDVENQRINVKKKYDIDQLQDINNKLFLLKNLEEKCRSHQNHLSLEKKTNQDLYNSVLLNRKIKLNELKKMRTQQSEELLKKLNQHENKIKMIKESNEQKRQHKKNTSSKLRAKKTQKIHLMLHNNEILNRRRARSLEIDSLNASNIRKNDLIQKIKNIQDKNAVQEELRRTILLDLKEEQLCRTKQILKSIHTKNQLIEKNRKERNSLQKKMWMSPKVFGQLPLSTKKQLEKQKKKEEQQKKKKKKKQQKDILVMEPMFQSPSSLLPPLETDDLNNGINSKEEELLIINNSNTNTEMPFALKRLLKQQKLQMTMLLDEEEQFEKERRLSLKKSESFRRKQVGKCFNYKRQKGVERILRMKEEHEVVLNAYIKNRNTIR